MMDMATATTAMLAWLEEETGGGVGPPGVPEAGAGGTTFLLRVRRDGRRRKGRGGGGGGGENERGGQKGRERKGEEKHSYTCSHVQTYSVYTQAVLFLAWAHLP